MDFKNAFEHYKNGAASEEERRFVEEEIEKSDLVIVDDLGAEFATPFAEATVIIFIIIPSLNYPIREFGTSCLSTLVR